MRVGDVLELDDAELQDAPDPLPAEQRALISGEFQLDGRHFWPSTSARLQRSPRKAPWSRNQT
ncbi:hypothetical protein LWF01_19220 [Saxibacter everestensis]|uniref:Uncharacterized protein n=1 Tax=Saxibacter everestensis TaxID=2909229 RepID=A0ABY8QT35_9MICO|nr:hypothetical protein LWF01_19220 [Brevibacteriaceae bacterium ZFBP1038]